MDIVEFLTARLDEDEAAAKVRHDDWADYDGWAELHQDVKAHAWRHDPPRVLREVAAKRAIIAAHWDGNGCPTCLIEMSSEEDSEGGSHDYPVMHWTEPCPALRHLAAVYADHPDFVATWLP